MAICVMNLESVLKLVNLKTINCVILVLKLENVHRITLVLSGHCSLQLSNVVHTFVRCFCSVYIQQKYIFH